MRFCWLPSNLTMMRRLQEVHSPTHNTKEAANLLGLLNKPKTVCDILSMDFRKDSVFLKLEVSRMSSDTVHPVIKTGAKSFSVHI